jgi:hypothetical protein
MQDFPRCDAALCLQINCHQPPCSQLIWEQICEAMGKSVTAQLRSQSISTFLVSMRPVPGSWKGRQQSCLLHFAEQAHQHNDISKDPCAPRTSGACTQELEGCPTSSKYSPCTKLQRRLPVSPLRPASWNAMLHSCNKHRHMTLVMIITRLTHETFNSQLTCAKFSLRMMGLIHLK